MLIRLQNITPPTLTLIACVAISLISFWLIIFWLGVISANILTNESSIDKKTALQYFTDAGVHMSLYGQAYIICLLLWRFDIVPIVCQIVIWFITVMTAIDSVRITKRTIMFVFKYNAARKVNNALTVYVIQSLSLFVIGFAFSIATYVIYN